MIDLALLRTNPDCYIALLQKKEPSYDARHLYELDMQVRQHKIELDQLRKQKNDLAQKGKAGVTDQLRQESLELGQKIKNLEENVAIITAQFNELYLAAPNIPDESVPEGNKEENSVVRVFGSEPLFNFPIKNHVELAEQLGWVDFRIAAKVAGSNFALYKGLGAKLIYALSMFMLKHNEKHGFSIVVPPYLVNEQSLEVAGNFPKFKEQVYSLPGDNLYLIPTSEVSLANMYRDHIFMAEELPLRMTSYTSCFRREAGTYGAAERGLIRIHQFEKVELYTICHPENSMQELDRMIACAEDILQQLGLHYRVSLLAAQDCSFQSAKTYDIEVWFPSQKTYKEVSSASNCTDFQARRGLMRFRQMAGDKPELVHTLNASSLALPRLMVALMETYQQADGTVQLPDVLYQGGLL